MDFYDVSDWIETSAASTKGTRDKLVLMKPGTDEVYFLKFPMVRKMRDYSPENWSEVLAYEVGTMLGFNVLKYELAAYNGKVGCISMNMVNSEMNESLIEGHSILSRFDETYDPSDKSMYSKYTFNFVRDALYDFGAPEYVEYFIKMLVFDSIIGNSDRHQSNWGIIQSIERNNDGNRIVRRPAPIYDSGCCLGREYGQEQIIQHLEIRSKFDKYIRNGKSELRVPGYNEKPSHEELIKFIMGTDDSKWMGIVDGEIARIAETYRPNDINAILMDVDANMPLEYRTEYGLTAERKMFIFRVINERINKLKDL